MRPISFLLLLFITSTNSLEFKAGTYKPVYRKKKYADTAAKLSLNQDQSFVREYTMSRMCIGLRTEWDVGIWLQSGDTLILTDTLLFNATLKPTISRIFGIDDTVIVRKTVFKIKKAGRLEFIECSAGKVKYHLPDFTFESEKENRKSRMFRLD